ncbi:hypothetical protein C0674_04620 [Sporolactobacillus terrae]|uniref:DUF1672 domain-containing protein n=1 Tax=Sporolactobacillus terrae TaxID=269673 RepID=A0ABX5Q5P4_9BACL|nr:hypothetical protein C0674_04620 [Sporolactobacillus terrae]QAA24931.1 hypothetical protein C0679_04595 [Sporolactobacillus terrae]
MKTMKLVIPTLILSILLGGCSTLENDHQGTSSTKKEQEKHYENNFISVQKYTGQGYSLDGGEENDKIAEAHRAEVVKAAEQFFLKKYKTKVKVHNLVGNRDGVTVFVESVGEPHFYTYAVVPIEQDKIVGSETFSQEDQVEGAIRSGIYAMIYANEIHNLDDYLKQITSKYPVVGKTSAAVANVGGNDYSTPYYYITILDTAINVDVVKIYLKHPEWTKDDWQKRLLKATLDPEQVWITIQLYMKESDRKPDRALFNEVVSDVEVMKSLPPGAYSILLHDNRIGKDSATGSKTNSLERGDPDEIIKR